MKRLLILLSLCFALLLSACQSKTPAPNSNSDSSVETETSTIELLYDFWQIKYYSKDNEIYNDYTKDISPYGTMTFDKDSPAVIAWDENDVTTYDFSFSPEQDVITFNEYEGEKTMDFYFGFKVAKNGESKNLIISRYNATTKETDYFVLLPSE